MFDLKVNESYKHKLAKELLFNWIVVNNTDLIDQFNNSHYIDDDFVAVESPVFKELGEGWVPYHQIGSCDDCLSDITEHQWEGHISAIENKNIRPLDTRTLSGCYFNHPCNECDFNKLYTYQFIFDIGIGHEGNYINAIEVLNTSKVSDKKLIYCIRNNINLFEVKADWVLKQTKIPKNIKANRLWWRENGEVFISDHYRHLEGIEIS